MWMVSGQALKMVEKDWGIELPISVSGITFTAQDAILFTLKTEDNGDTLLEKEFTNITQNTIRLELTEEESNALKVGTYVYSLDWYQDGAFLCNIIPSAMFKVVDKA